MLSSAPARLPIPYFSVVGNGVVGGTCTASGFACAGHSCGLLHAGVSWIVTLFSHQPAPPASTSARDRLELALTPLSSTSTPSDSMPPEVDAAASSTTGQCFRSAPMTYSSRAGWLCSSELRKHHSPSDGRWPANGSRLVSWARRAPPALNHSLLARPNDACVLRDSGWRHGVVSVSSLAASNREKRLLAIHVVSQTLVTK